MSLALGTAVRVVADISTGTASEPSTCICDSTTSCSPYSTWSDRSSCRFLERITQLPNCVVLLYHLHLGRTRLWVFRLATFSMLGLLGSYHRMLDVLDTISGLSLSLGAREMGRRPKKRDKKTKNYELKGTRKRKAKKPPPPPHC
jgi:hypothetical protein